MSTITDTEHLPPGPRTAGIRDVGGFYHVAERRIYRFEDFKHDGNPKTRYWFGRGLRCDLKMQDTAVSALHFTVTRKQDGTYLLEDSKSTNGTYVEGTRVESAVLARGLHIEAGRCQLIVVGADGKLPLEARTESSFRVKAALAYGSDREAARAIHKSEATVRRARQKREENDRMANGHVFSGRPNKKGG